MKVIEDRQVMPAENPLLGLTIHLSATEVGYIKKYAKQPKCLKCQERIWSWYGSSVLNDLVRQIQKVGLE